MSHFSALINKRESTRAYKSTPVEEIKLARCLEAARLAPSASNSQPWTFIVVNEPQLKQQVAQATFSKTVSFNKFTLESPIIIAVVTERSKIMAQMGNFLKKQQYNLIDIGIATEHFCLQAAEDGLGTCIMGWFDEKKIKSLLNVPKNKRINIVISLGYPADEDIREKIRKPLNQIVRYNSY
ncbi:MAG: NAD(P)H nitroreductase [Bacteroidetes bacterium 4572_77]|nr:MAG: NAD(P)H nitroreductase [Bacteroidetes bacterium 4572_77]